MRLFPLATLLLWPALAPIPYGHARASADHVFATQASKSPRAAGFAAEDEDKLLRKVTASPERHSATAEAGDECGVLLEKIDRLLTIAKLDRDTGPRIEALRDQGAAFYRAGRIAECRQSLWQAAQLLGMDAH